MLTRNQVQKRLQRQKVVAEIQMQNQQLQIQMPKKMVIVSLHYYHSNKLEDIELDQHQHQIQEIALNHYSVASYQRI